MNNYESKDSQKINQKFQLYHYSVTLRRVIEHIVKILVIALMHLLIDFHFLCSVSKYTCIDYHFSLLQAANAQYTFQVGSPGDDYYLAVRTNSDNSQYVDILLEGDADGWVAVGLSDNRQMVSGLSWVCGENLVTVHTKYMYVNHMKLL